VRDIDIVRGEKEGKRGGKGVRGGVRGEGGVDASSQCISIMFQCEGVVAEAMVWFVMITIVCEVDLECGSSTSNPSVLIRMEKKKKKMEKEENRIFIPQVV